MDTQKTNNKAQRDDALRGRFTSWLNTVLRRARIRYLQEHEEKLETISISDLPEDVADGNNYYAKVERSQVDFDFEEEKLSRAFRELPLMRREVLRLIFVEEKTTQEVAAILNCSEGFVYKQKSRALIRLREVLSEEGLYDDEG